MEYSSHFLSSWDEEFSQEMLIFKHFNKLERLECAPKGIAAYWILHCVLLLSLINAYYICSIFIGEVYLFFCHKSWWTRSLFRCTFPDDLPEQWSSTFSLLWTFSIVPHLVVMPPIQLYFFLFHRCNFATIIKYRVNIYILWWS